MKRKIVIVFLFFIGIVPRLSFADNVDLQRTVSDPAYMAESEKLNGIPMDEMRINDLQLLQTTYAAGGDLFGEFFRFLFPISGREKRTMFLPLSFWGPKKPRFHKLEWKRFESAHFDFYAYPESQTTLNTVIKYYEEEYDRNNRVFGVENKFTKKIPIIFYQSRRDFEQTAIVDGPIPEGLGGLTEVLSWRRVTFPFEGDKYKLEHVAKHEGTHVFQIAKNARKLPLWVVEGSAETNSIYWDSEAEMLARDAFINGFFLHIPDLWQINGSWLMYKIGNFICNVIWDEYGEEGFRKIFENASSKNFESNIKDSLGITVEELDQKVQATLLEKYSYLLHRDDAIKKSKQIDEHRVSLASYDRFFVSGGASGPRLALYINHFDNDGKITKKIFSEDKNFDNETFEAFTKGVYLTKEYIVYAVKKSAFDELRIIPYLYNEKKKKFIFSEERKYSWPGLDRIQNPVWIADQRVAFIGYQNGYSNIYSADLLSSLLNPITHGKVHYSDLDYSPVRNELIYSKEGERDPHRIFYNRDLFTYNLATKESKQITNSLTTIETEPRFSPDGKKIVYVSTPDLTMDLMIKDLDTGIETRLTRMNVAAQHPEWSINNSILYNGYKGMRPTIYQMTIPTSKELIQSALVGNGSSSFVLKDEKFITPAIKEPKKPTDDLVLDGLYVSAKTPVVRFQNRNYTADSVAPIDQDLIIKATEGLPNEKNVKHEPLPRYFKIHGTNIESLKSMMVADEGIPDEVRKWASLQLNGREIIHAWMSRDRDRALLLVNNRLAAEYDSYHSKPAVSLFVFDQSQNHLQELPNSPVKSLSKEIQFVAFMNHDQIFLATGEKKTGPFFTYVYSLPRKNYSILDREASQFRISADQTKVLTKQKHFTLYDFEKPHGDLGYTEIPIFSTHDKDFAFDFDNQNRATFFTVSEKSKQWTYSIDSGDHKIFQTFTQPRKKNEIVQKAVISRDGFAAVIVHEKKKNEIQQLWIWDTSQNRLFPLKIDGDNYTSMIFRKNYLTFYSSYFDSRPVHETIWTPDFGDSTLTFDMLHDSKLANSKFIFEGKDHLSIYDQSTSQLDEISPSTIGFWLEKDDLYYSAQLDHYFQIFDYNLQTKTKKQLTSTDYNKWGPIIREGQLNYIVDNNNQKSIEKLNTATGETKIISAEGFNVEALTDGDDEIKLQASRQLQEKPTGPEHVDGPEYPTFLQSQPIKHTLRLQNVAAAAAYDGSAFRYFFSGYADNMFSDKGVFFDAVFLGDTKFATVGVSDLNSGINTSYFYNIRDGIENTGIDITKNIIFDRYRMLSPYMDFEYQQYSGNSSALNSFIDSTYDNKNFYLLKFGAVYSYDVSVWDRHGPISGSRLYFRAETGMDTVNPRVSNADANIDVRVYNQILPRFSLAHRLSGGTSQGPVPNIYLVGGNLSFRGVGFDDLVGQNYWVFSEDIRLPVFDFVGAKLFDPLDYFLGIFTRYFDVRAGIYTDVGSTWMNKDDPNLIYSVGYFVNIPTIFGFIVRLNQGFLGEKNFGFWFGSNW